MAISDRKMFELWRKRESLRKRAAKLDVEKKKIDQALLAEFERRGTKSLTSRETGERITYIAPETPVYIESALRRKLSLSARGRRILQRCLVEQIDMKAIASEVAAGNIPPRIVAACTEMKPSAPYLKSGGGGE